jgi:hypothetical protein
MESFELVRRNDGIEDCRAGRDLYGTAFFDSEVGDRAILDDRSVAL